MRDELVYPLSRPGAGPETSAADGPAVRGPPLVDAVIKVRKQGDLVEKQVGEELNMSDWSACLAR